MDTIEVSHYIESTIERISRHSKSYELIKRSMDVFISFVALIILMPVCVLIAAFIKSVSHGPILFKQTRLGRFGRPFEIYKFRTMKVDAEKYSGPVWAKQNDHRLIPGGDFLRKAHLDEIPQFINVLRGEMSIIGPRPERPYFVAQLKNQIYGYEKRLLIKPGITGLAQVQHRADETLRDVQIKIKYDLFYLRKMCFLVDIRILVQTLGVILAGGIQGRIPEAKWEKVTNKRDQHIHDLSS
jgi:lipopolysaccharide/colanic/teichoic acid biosynthesis glycosyltransferase